MSDAVFGDFSLVRTYPRLSVSWQPDGFRLRRRCTCGGVCTRVRLAPCHVVCVAVAVLAKIASSFLAHVCAPVCTRWYVCPSGRVWRGGCPVRPKTRLSRRKSLWSRMGVPPYRVAGGRRKIPANPRTNRTSLARAWGQRADARGEVDSRTRGSIPVTNVSNRRDLRWLEAARSPNSALYVGATRKGRAHTQYVRACAL